MADDQLLNEHQQIWKGFVRFITISTVLVIAALALMALFLL
jgi:LPS O-antigen subunit length determinant protein (WzzB/FepE family)